jgi:hypothetical protein
MNKKSSLELQWLEELSKLDSFVIKTPVHKLEFWTEWQEKYSKARMGGIACMRMLRKKGLDSDQIRNLRDTIDFYDSVLEYLNEFKNIALNVRGFFFTTDTFEIDDEDIDLDF